MEQFNQWDVILTLSAFFGLVALILKPAITLVKTLSTLVIQIDSLGKNVGKYEEANATEHKGFKDKLGEHDNLLRDHDNILKQANYTQ